MAGSLNDYLKLQQFLRDADTLGFLGKIYNLLGIHRVTDLRDLTQNDASGIGMTPPQFQRLMKRLDKLRKAETSPMTKLGNIFFKKSDRQTNEKPISSEIQQSRCIISRDHLMLGKHLGGFSDSLYVRRGEWRDDSGSKVSVAVKSYRPGDGVQSSFNDVSIHQEANRLNSLNHPNIIRLYGVVLTSPIMLVFELAPLGDMKRMLWLEEDTFPAILLHRYAHQIVSGMEYLAAKEIVHRALRAKNILMIDRFTSKIGNFGLARCLGSEECYKKRDSSYEPPGEWTAPEALMTGRFTVDSDVWSYGILLWEMFSHGATPPSRPPLHASETSGERTSTGRFLLPKTLHCPDHVYSLMCSCWASDPAQRASFGGLQKLVAKTFPSTAKVLASFQVESDPKKLSLVAGETITVTDMSTERWWYGQNSKGEYGQFLKDHVHVLHDSGDERPPPRLLAAKKPLATKSISTPVTPKHVVHIGRGRLSESDMKDITILLQQKCIGPPEQASASRKQTAPENQPERDTRSSLPPPLPIKTRRRPGLSHAAFSGRRTRSESEASDYVPMDGGLLDKIKEIQEKLPSQIPSQNGSTGDRGEKKLQQASRQTDSLQQRFKERKSIEEDE